MLGLITRMNMPLLVCLLAGSFCFCSTAARSATLDPKLQTALAGAAGTDRFPVIIVLSDRADLSRFRDRDASLRRRRIVAALKQQANLGQRGLETFFAARGISNIKRLWLINGVAATLPASVISTLSHFPAVESIKLDEPVPLPVMAAAVPELTIGDVSVNEGGSAVFTVTLSEASAVTVTVDYTTVNDTATAGADYVALNFNLTFFPGQTSRTIPVSILEDLDIESDETFFLTLSNAVGATITTPSGTLTATGTIIDNDTPRLSIDDVTVDEGAGTALFTVSRLVGLTTAVTVDFATSDGTAAAGNDYTAVTGQLSFALGETSRTVEVPIVDDVDIEGDETFDVTLGNLSIGTLLDAVGTATITDNDTPRLGIDDVTVDEAAGTAVFTVTRAGLTGPEVTVDFATSDATASAGADYTAATGQLVLAPSAASGTIPVSVLEDALIEGDELFNVTLSNPVNGILVDATGLGTILDNEAPASIPTWNITATGAPDLWAMGHIGQGTVVASIDTGVDVNHPDLAPRWRGGSNSWFDVHGQYLTPFDAAGHGTRTMGLMVGGDANQELKAIGMAPGAKWIAAKVWDDFGNASLSDFTLAFQWVLDPDGNPATDDAPDVVNNSWGFELQPGLCETVFQTDIQILKAAGIAVVFAAGNRGALGPQSDISPGNNPEGYAVGAVDQGLTVASYSSRGPSTCDSTVFAEVVAPGDQLITTDLSSGGNPTVVFPPVSGTSFAAPHVSGAMALLLSAFPDTTVPHLEAVLINTARDLGDPGPDNDYGYGLIDVVAAYNNLLGCPTGGADSDGDGIPDGCDNCAATTNPRQADADGDGAGDACDNCTLVANGPILPDAGGNSQRDTDGDGFGNICDADFNQNGIVDPSDFTKLKSVIGLSGHPDQDLNGNSIIDPSDFTLTKALLGQPPGPAGVLP